MMGRIHDQTLYLLSSNGSVLATDPIPTTSHTYTIEGGEQSFILTSSRNLTGFGNNISYLQFNMSSNIPSLNGVINPTFKSSSLPTGNLTTAGLPAYYKNVNVSRNTSFALPNCQ